MNITRILLVFLPSGQTDTPNITNDHRNTKERHFHCGETIGCPKEGDLMYLDVGLPLAIAAVAAVMDLRTARVDNGWILFSLAMGFIFSICRYGLRGSIRFAEGALFPLLVLLVLFYFRMLGPGDIKLFCVLGGVLGAESIGRCMAVSFILGAVFSLAFLICYGGFRRRVLYLIRYLGEYLRTGEAKPYYRKGMPPENFHFTIPVFLSIVLYAGGVY